MMFFLIASTLVMLWVIYLAVRATIRILKEYPTLDNQDRFLGIVFIVLYTISITGCSYMWYLMISTFDYEIQMWLN